MNIVGIIGQGNKSEVGFIKASDLSFFDKEENQELIQIEFLAKSDWVIDEKLEEE